MKARDMMTFRVVTIGEGESVETARDLIVEESIKGLPVLDAEGKLCGIVTQSDLFQIWEMMEQGWLKKDEFINETKVRDVMVKKVVTVQEDATLDEVSKTIVENSVHRVLVMDGENVSGIISTLDLLKILTRSGEIAYKFNE
ncbi:CBS domain-containing protein [bacterium]|jgi:acetoin utilization protein AcuB|nr:CBS domain-containing protein [bacterium]